MKDICRTHKQKRCIFTYTKPFFLAVTQRLSDCPKVCEKFAKTFLFKFIMNCFDLKTETQAEN